MDESIGQIRQIAGAKIERSNFKKMQTGEIDE